MRFSALFLASFFGCSLDRAGLGSTSDGATSDGADRVEPVDASDRMDRSDDLSADDGSGKDVPFEDVPVDAADASDTPLEADVPDPCAVDPRIGMMCDGPDLDMCPEGMWRCVSFVVECSDSTDDTLERCGGGDEDCDGQTDEPGALGEQMLYVDRDGDGYGDASGATMRCSAGAGYSTRDGDCNDSDATRFPGATETCNGRDDDCSGAIDDDGIVASACPCQRYARFASTYQFCNSSDETWHDSRAWCRSHGYDLAVVDSALEDGFVGFTANAIESANWWFGLTDEVTEGEFIWVNGAQGWTGGPPLSGGSAVGHANFGGNQPDDLGSGQDCVQYNSTGTSWSDRPCDDPRKFICEVQP